MSVACTCAAWINMGLLKRLRPGPCVNRLTFGMTVVPFGVFGSFYSLGNIIFEGLFGVPGMLRLLFPLLFVVPCELLESGLVLGRPAMGKIDPREVTVVGGGPMI